MSASDRAALVGPAAMPRASSKASSGGGRRMRRRGTCARWSASPAGSPPASCWAFIGVGVAFIFRTERCLGRRWASCCAPPRLRCCGRSPRSDFVAQFALALSLAGQAMVVVGLFALFSGRQDRVVYAIIDGIRAGARAGGAVLRSIARGPRWLPRWRSCSRSSRCASRFCFPRLVAAGFVAVELNEARLARHADIWQPVSAGPRAVAAAARPGDARVFALRRASSGTRGLHDTSTAWRGSALVALILIVTVAMLLARNGVRLGGRAGVATLAACVALAAAWQVPAIIAAVIVVIVAFASGRRALMGLGLVALAATLGHHYFSLDGTLLAKSAVAARRGRRCSLPRGSPPGTGS